MANTERLMWICYRPRGLMRRAKWHLLPMTSIDSGLPITLSLCDKPLERESFGRGQGRRLCQHCAAFAKKHGLRPPWHGGDPHRIAK